MLRQSVDDSTMLTPPCCAICLYGVPLEDGKNLDGTQYKCIRKSGIPTGVPASHACGEGLWLMRDTLPKSEIENLPEGSEYNYTDFVNTVLNQMKYEDKIGRTKVQDEELEEAGFFSDGMDIGSGPMVSLD